MDNCNGCQTPMDPNSFPTRKEPDDVHIDPTSYQLLIGSVNFLVTGTRPDLAFPYTALSTFNAKPAIRHLNVVKGMLRYVRKTLDYTLNFPKQKIDFKFTELDIHTDTLYNTDPDNSKVFSGYIQLLNRGPVAWSSKRQTTVVKSTCEAEYMACSSALLHLQ